MNDQEIRELQGAHDAYLDICMREYWDSDNYWDGIEAVIANSPVKRLVFQIVSHKFFYRTWLDEVIYKWIVEPAEKTLTTIVHGAASEVWHAHNEEE
jgi:hypothetical protein